MEYTDRWTDGRTDARTLHYAFHQTVSETTVNCQSTEGDQGKPTATVFSVEVPARYIIVLSFTDCNVFISAGLLILLH